MLKCKSALNKSRLYGLDYTINPYLGCSHACIYCYVPSLIHIPYDEFKIAKPKINIVDVLRKELRKKKHGIVGISTATDAYQPLEKKYELTRGILKTILQYDFPIDIQTKSKLVLRDAGIIKKFSDARVGITITTFNESIAKKWEVFAPSPYKRLETAKKLSMQGIYTYIFFGPIFPLMNGNEIDYSIEEFIEAGVDEIIIDKLHLKEEVIKNIKKFFPVEYKEIIKEAKNFNKKLKEIEKFGNKITIIKAWE